MTDLPKPPPGSITKDIARTDKALVERAMKFPTATLHEAGGQIGALPMGIKPVWPGFKLCGTAVTVHSPPRDNLWLHRALYVCQPGDVLVAFVSDFWEAGYFGEIMAHAAIQQGVVGLVIDGCVRDADLLKELNFPVFSRGLSIRGTGKDHHARGWINQPVMIGEITVAPGDLVVGDIDGVVAIPKQRVAATLDASQAREDKEAGTIQMIEHGEKTIELYGWTT